MTASGSTSKLHETDALVVGAGPAGLIAALLLARAGFKTTIADRADPARPASLELRSAALLAPALSVLERVDVAGAVRAAGTPLRTMRLIEVGGPEDAARRDAAFEAEEIGQHAFGVNIANDALRAALLRRAQETPELTLRAPAALTHLLASADGALAQFSDGTRVSARLVIGADGRESAVRRSAGIQARRFDYGQTAMVFHVAHDAPHQNASTEILREGGPFTLTPFTPGPGGAPRSAVVWMEKTAKAERLLALSEEAFAMAATERSRGVLGPLKLVSPRIGWKVISLLAERLHARRVALIAEAAHVVPPIGAQGLNMSVKDAETLTALLCEARKAGRDIGAETTLARLTRTRFPDIAARVAATAALNGAAMGALGPLKDLRWAGLSLVHGVAPLRRAAMRFGLG